MGSEVRREHTEMDHRMKVLRSGSCAPWSGQLECSRCSALLLVELTDLLRTGGDELSRFHGMGEDTVSFRCPECEGLTVLKDPSYEQRRYVMSLRFTES